MRLLSAFAILLWLMAVPAAAQTAEEQAQLDWVQQRGWALYELDRAAWVATDDMVERIRDPSSTGLRGYIVEREGSALVVTFYGGPGEAPVAIYRGRVENRRVVGREVFAAAELPPLTAMQRRLASVREIANRLGHRPCQGRSFNTVVIPPESLEDSVDLYLLTPQARAREWPLGGHYRATVAADGTVTSSRAFTRSCITLGGSERPDATTAALFITHVLDPLPTEIHVFTMWTSELPLGVGTTNPDRVWWLSSRGIELESNIRD